MPKSTSQCVSAPTHARSVVQRRGFAMMLVMIALGAATVLTVSNMASKNSAGAIGDNAASAVKASWSAKSAAEIGVSILQTQIDWRTAITDGTLLSNQSIAGGNVSITFSNLTGGLPTSADLDLVMTVTSSVGGVDSTVQKIIHVTPDSTPASAVDAGLNEFTIFTNNSVQIAPDGVVGVWAKSPAALSATPAKVGLGFTSGASYDINNAATVVKTALFVPNDASASVESELDNGQWAGGAKLPVHIPAIAKLVPSSYTAIPPVPIDINIDNKTQNLPSAYFKKVTIKNGSVVTLDDAMGSLWAFDKLEIDSGSVLVIKGQVQIRVDDDFRVKNKSAVELATPDSTLTLIVYDNVNIDNSSVGFDRTVGFDPDRSRDGAYAYADPRQIRIYGGYRTEPDDPLDLTDLQDLDFGDFDGGDQEMRIKKKSLVCASIYAPLAKVVVEKDATLFGRVTADRLEIKSKGGVFGDPSLDSGVGFTALDGPLYTAAGDPVPGLAAALSSANAASGEDAVQAAIVAAVAAANTGGTGSTGVGSAPTTTGFTPPDTPPTPRKQVRAVAQNWPLQVMVMESDDATPPAAGDFTGSFNNTNTNDTNTQNTQALATIPQ